MSQLHNFHTFVYKIEIPWFIADYFPYSVFEFAVVFIVLHWQCLSSWLCSYYVFMG